MKYVLTTILVLLHFSTAAGARKLSGEGEEEEIKSLSNNSPAAAFTLSMKTKSDSVSGAAFGMFIKGTGGLDTTEVAEKIKIFSQREGMFFRAIAIASYHPKADGIIQALAEHGSKDLAAGMAHWRAKTSYLEVLNRADKARLMNALGVEKLSQKRRGASKKVTIPAALIQTDQTAVQERAILAAAYAKAKEHTDLISSIQPKAPGVLAAQLLYRAMMGETLSTNETVEVAGTLLRVKNPMTQVTAATSTWDPLAPPGCAFVEALGTTKDAAHLPILHKALFHQDIRIQADAARAIKNIASDKSLPVLARRLTDCGWPIAIELCDTFTLMPDKRLIGPLINRLGKERGRIRQDLVFALSVIAAEQHGETVPAWAAWYRKAGASFEVDPKASKEYRFENLVGYTSVPSYGYFYGIKIYSDRFCFVIDTSASMRGGRIADLRSNMVQCLNSLKGNPGYNIVDFGGDVVTMYDGTLTDDRAVGLKRVEEMPLTFATRSFDALERAGELNGVDTLLFLSDGAPVRGQIDSWVNIRSALQLMNLYRPLAIQSIDFDPQPGNMEQMRMLALENNGQHMSVEVGIDPDAADRKPKKKK
jgi:hypothetical protein